MSFIKKASEAEFYQSLEENLYLVKNAEKHEAIQTQADGMVLLAYAADLLDEIGFETEAAMTTKLLEKIAWHVPTSDPASSGLSSEKMESNLKEKGWVFNVSDSNSAEDGVEVEEGDDKNEAEDGEIMAVYDPETGVTKDFENDVKTASNHGLDPDVLRAYNRRNVEHHEQESPHLETMKFAAKMLNHYSPKDVLGIMREHGLSEQDAYLAVEAGKFINQGDGKRIVDDEVIVG